MVRNIYHHNVKMILFFFLFVFLSNVAIFIESIKGVSVFVLGRLPFTSLLQCKNGGKTFAISMFRIEQFGKTQRHSPLVKYLYYLMSCR